MGYKEWAYLYTPRYIEELNHVIDMHKELNRLCTWEFYSYIRWLQACFQKDKYYNRLRLPQANTKMADMVWFDMT